MMKPASQFPIVPLTAALALVGALIPSISLVTGDGIRSTLNDAGLLVVFWGLSPFILFPLAMRLAKRSWVRRMILVLTGVAVLFGAVGYLVLLPRRTGTAATVLSLFLPVWQWPMSLLAGALSVFGPSEEQERDPPGDGE